MAIGRVRAPVGKLDFDLLGGGKLSSCAPVVTNEQNEQSVESKEIAVMVPEEFLDEAHVVIESQQAYDDFYDFALDEEEDSDFDSDLFEEEF